MTSFLSLAAGLVIGFLGGWVLRGRKANVQHPAEATTGAAPTEPESVQESIAEPAIVAPAESVAVLDPEPADVPVLAKADPVPAPEPIEATPWVVEAQAPVSEPEPIAEPEPVVEPIPVAQAAPATETEVLSAETPATRAAESAGATAVIDEPALRAALPKVDAVPAQRTGLGSAAKQDNLTSIPGIGPKMAQALRSAGITSLTALAVSDETTIRAAIAAAGLRFTPSATTWPQQAKLLVDGDK